MKDIILTAINAKWIHPSLALRLLKANLGAFEERCDIIEFALRQPLGEKIRALLDAFPPDGKRRILGVSVSIWNHAQTIELLKELFKEWQERPAVVLGGPEVSHLPPDARIFQYADYIIRGEGETAFRELCETILSGNDRVGKDSAGQDKFYAPRQSSACKNTIEIKPAYYLYTDEDIKKKLIYVESSRGCPFGCEFCLSASDKNVHEFPLDQFLSEMDILIRRGVKTFKFLDRSFNINMPRALRIIDFFLEKINHHAFIVHFEMVPSLFPKELREKLVLFPPDTLRLEIGIQTLNSEVSARIGRPSNPEKELEALRFLSENTNAVIHADLIAGLPGEDLASFGEGFDKLWKALSLSIRNKCQSPEIQPGILKLLPGALIIHQNKEFGMRYSKDPPYEVIETSAMSADDIRRVKNFARFWELLVNRKMIKMPINKPVFNEFIELSSLLLRHFDKNWGIDKLELIKKVKEINLFNQMD